MSLHTDHNFHELGFILLDLVYTITIDETFGGIFYIIELSKHFPPVSRNILSKTTFSGVLQLVPMTSYSIQQKEFVLIVRKLSFSDSLNGLTRTRHCLKLKTYLVEVNVKWGSEEFLLRLSPTPTSYLAVTQLVYCIYSHTGKIKKLLFFVPAIVTGIKGLMLFHMSYKV